MNINELRIGSWIFDSGDEQKCFQVEQICKNNDGFSGYYIVFRNGSFKSSIDSDLIQPIELTTEVLEKCGGRISDSGVNWKNPEYEIWVFRDMLVGRLNGKFYLYNNCEDDFYSWYSPEITYLHQFQNLYYCLCSEELEVKL